MLNIPVNKYGHVGTVSSPYHILPGQAWQKGQPVLRAHTFASNWQQSFLNQPEVIMILHTFSTLHVGICRYRVDGPLITIVDTVLYVWHNEWEIPSCGTSIEAMTIGNLISDVIVDTVLCVWHNEWEIYSEKSIEGY